MSQTASKKMALKELDDVLITSKDIEIDRSEDGLLGRGGYGSVFKGKYRGKTVAVKMLIDQGAIPKHQKHSLLKEARRLKTASAHKNIIKLFGVVMEKDNYSLVLEYMLFGDCVHFIQTYDVGIPLRVQFVKQVVSAMAWLHSQKPPMKHLDLKADNVLINHHFDAKISDFGLSEWHTVTLAYSTQPLEKGNRCGTLSHIPPEVFKDINKKGSIEEDVYAFGITAWEIFSGEKPYKALGNRQDLISHAVMNNQRPDMNKLVRQCPQEVKDMILVSWDMDPSRRPPFKALENHILPVFNRMLVLIPESIGYIRHQMLDHDDERYIATSHFDNTGGGAAVANGITDRSVYPSSPDGPTDSKPAGTPSAGADGIPGEHAAGRDTEILDSKVRQDGLDSAGRSFEGLAIETGDHRMEHSFHQRAVNLPQPCQEGKSSDDRNNPYDHVPIAETRQQETGGTLTNDAQPSDSFSGVFSIQSKRYIPGNQLPAITHGQPALGRTNEDSFGICGRYREDGNGLHRRREESFGIAVRTSDSEHEMNGGQSEQFQNQHLEPAEENVNTGFENPDLLRELISHPDALRTYMSLTLSSIEESAPERTATPKTLAVAAAENAVTPAQRKWFIPTYVPKTDELFNSPHASQSDDTPNQSTHASEDVPPHDSQEDTHQVNVMGDLPSPPNRTTDLQHPTDDSTNQSMHASEDVPPQDSQEDTHQVNVMGDLPSPPNRTTDLQQPNHLPNISRNLPSRMTMGAITVDQFSGAPGQSAVANQRTRRQTSDVTEEDRQGATPLMPRQPTTATANAEPRMFPPTTQPTHVPGQSVNAGRSTGAISSFQPESEQRTTTNVTSAKQRSQQSYLDQREGSADRSEPRPLSGRPAGSQSSERSTGAGAMAQPIIISHKHAGGGFTTVKIDPNSKFPPNFQVGNNNCMVVGGKDRRKSADKKKTKKCRRSQLTTSEAELSMDNIDLVAVEIGKDWKRLCRELDMSEADIEQLQFDFHVSGLYEIMYQGIQRWIQRNGRVATVRKMAEALWEIDRDDIALRLKEN